MELLGTMKRYIQTYGIPPQDVIEDMLAVSCGARPGGACRLTPPNGTDIYPAPENLEAGLYGELKASVGRDIGNPDLKARFIIMPTSMGNSAAVMCLFKDDYISKKIDEINALFKRGWESLQTGEIDEAIFQATLYESEILGIPGCCTEVYINELREKLKMLGNEYGWETVLEIGRSIDRTTGKAPGDQDIAEGVIKIGGLTERRARKQLSAVMGMDAEYAEMRPKVFKGLPFEKVAPYFAFEVFPCRPDCKEATKMGERIYNDLKKLNKKVAKTYRKCVLPGNAFRVWSGIHPSLAAEYMMYDLLSVLSGEQSDATPKTMQGDMCYALNPFGRVGRNEPCPCGSGSKYKKCCGRP